MIVHAQEFDKWKKYKAKINKAKLEDIVIEIDGINWHAGKEKDFVEWFRFTGLNNCDFIDCFRDRIITENNDD